MDEGSTWPAETEPRNCLRSAQACLGLVTQQKLSHWRLKIPFPSSALFSPGQNLSQVWSKVSLTDKSHVGINLENFHGREAG